MPTTPPIWIVGPILGEKAHSYESVNPQMQYKNYTNQYLAQADLIKRCAVRVALEEKAKRDGISPPLVDIGMIATSKRKLKDYMQHGIVYEEYKKVIYQIDPSLPNPAAPGSGPPPAVNKRGNTRKRKTAGDVLSDTTKVRTKRVRKGVKIDEEETKADPARPDVATDGDGIVALQHRDESWFTETFRREYLLVEQKLETRKAANGGINISTASSADNSALIVGYPSIHRTTLAPVKYYTTICLVANDSGWAWVDLGSKYSVIKYSGKTCPDSLIPYDIASQFTEAENFHYGYLSLHSYLHNQLMQRPSRRLQRTEHVVHVVVPKSIGVAFSRSHESFTGTNADEVVLSPEQIYNIHLLHARRLTLYHRRFALVFSQSSSSGSTYGTILNTLIEYLEWIQMKKNEDNKDKLAVAPIAPIIPGLDPGYLRKRNAQLIYCPVFNFEYPPFLHEHIRTTITETSQTLLSYHQQHLVDRLLFEKDINNNSKTNTWRLHYDIVRKVVSRRRQHAFQVIVSVEREHDVGVNGVKKKTNKQPKVRARPQCVFRFASRIMLHDGPKGRKAASTGTVHSANEVDLRKYNDQVVADMGSLVARTLDHVLSLIRLYCPTENGKIEFVQGKSIREASYRQTLDEQEERKTEEEKSCETSSVAATNVPKKSVACAEFLGRVAHREIQQTIDEVIAGDSEQLYLGFFSSQLEERCKNVDLLSCIHAWHAGSR